jgi:hypothetical protein
VIQTERFSTHNTSNVSASLCRLPVRFQDHVARHHLTSQSGCAREGVDKLHGSIHAGAEKPLMLALARNSVGAHRLRHLVSLDPSA